MNFLQCILAGAQHFIAVTKQTSHGGSLSTLWRGRTYRRERLVLREWLTLMPTPGDSAREPSDEFCIGAESVAVHPACTGKRAAPDLARHSGA